MQDRQTSESDLVIVRGDFELVGALLILLILHLKSGAVNL